MSDNDPRRGFRVIDLLVIIGVLVILFQLLFSHGHYSHESARRKACKDNLRQIGMAVQAYHSLHGSLPPGSLPNGATWSILLLPYLDEKDVYGSFNFDMPS